VVDSNLDTFTLWRGTGGSQPDFDNGSPYETGSLPHTTAAQDVSADSYFTARARNIYGLDDLCETTWHLQTDGSGNQTSTPPSGPTTLAFAQAPSEQVRITATYDYMADGDNAADTWLIYVTTGDVAPDPTADTPSTETMVKAQGTAQLSYLTATYAVGTRVNMLVRTRRVDTGPTNVDSTNLDIYRYTIHSNTMSAPPFQNA
jgi:hypothetical protein